MTPWERTGAVAAAFAVDLDHPDSCLTPFCSTCQTRRIAADPAPTGARS